MKSSPPDLLIRISSQTGKRRGTEHNEKEFRADQEDRRLNYSIMKTSYDQENEHKQVSTE